MIKHFCGTCFNFVPRKEDEPEGEGSCLAHPYRLIAMSEDGFATYSHPSVSGKYSLCSEHPENKLELEDHMKELRQKKTLKAKEVTEAEPTPIAVRIETVNG